MTIRAATEADVPVLGELQQAFEAELPEPPWVDVDPAEELAELRQLVVGEIAVVAEDDAGVIVGYALACRAGTRLGRVTDVYVVPDARGGGVATALVREAVARLGALGLDTVRLEVLASNERARSIYARWGFQEEELMLVAPLAALAERLAPATGASVGVVYVQTDDLAAVERAVTAFVPRIGSHHSEVAAPANGWIAVRDDVATGDPSSLRRLAKELSDRLGAVVLLLGVEVGKVARLVAYERGSVMDEYLSVPEYHGPLPPGDVVALSANPTVLGRLTGADHGGIKAAAPTAAAPSELPPAAAIAEGLAAVLGLPPFGR